jgi:glycosyltransferase involved in cell wall biosynthesis
MLARTALKMGELASIKFADATIAVSKTLTNYIALQYHKQAHYIANGITPRRVATDDVVLTPFGLRSGDYVAMVSRLVQHKSPHTLIDAWKMAKEMRPDLLKNKKLAIVGGSAFTDSYVKQLHQQAEGDASIVFTGYQTGEVLQALFAGAQFIAHPSTSEGLPIAILEAMSYGKCVVASDIPENYEIVEEHGVSFETENIEDLAEKLIERFEDPMGTAAIGHTARVFVEDEYNWDDIAVETLELYEKHLALREGVYAI